MSCSNSIINTVSYIRVKQKTTVFTKENQTDNIYFIIEKGTLEYNLDGTNYELQSPSSIGTRALDKNSLKTCYLKTKERCYLFCLPIEKYKTIFQDFVDKQFEDKMTLLSNHFFFKNLNNDYITNLALKSQLVRSKEQTILIEEDTLITAVFILIDGMVYCMKNESVIKIVDKLDIFGEIGLFYKVESLYRYLAEKGSWVLKITYQDLIAVFGDNILRILISSIFTTSIKENERLNNTMIGENVETLFDKFSLRFYYYDNIVELKEKKMIIPISGTTFKSTIYGKNQQNYNKIIFDPADNMIIPKGKVFFDSIINETSSSHFIVGDECVVYECDWDTIIKSFRKPSKSDLPILQQISFLRNHPLFKSLSEFKLFQLAEKINQTKYKKGVVILKDGPCSDKFYIIKSGIVEIKVGKTEGKKLEEKHTFGDISSQAGTYTRKADFIALSDVECYYIDKEVYDEIVDNDNNLINPLKNLIVMKDITITLESLYYVKELGSGSYGKVYLVHDQKKFYAMKTALMQLMKMKKETANLYLNEKTIMHNIDYPFIVQLINTFRTRTYIFFLMEFVDGFTLRSHLSAKTKGELHDIKETQFFGGILACVLNYLQKKKILHRDLKPDNLMIEFNGYLKVIDFGVAKQLTNKDTTNTFAGTMFYMSPEVILGKNYTSAVDYWALGIILYEIFYGRIPFGVGLKDPKSVYQEITEKKISFPIEESNPTLNLLIKGLLNKNPNKRISSFQKIYAHPLYNKYDFDSLIKMKLEPPFKPEKYLDKKLLEYVDIPFSSFMRNNDHSTTTIIDDVQVGDDLFSGF